MSAPETVRLTVDGVVAEVPKAAGLVEAAQGACRMCLCMVSRAWSAARTRRCVFPRPLHWSASRTGALRFRTDW
jgi:hypothetical protein